MPPLGRARRVRELRLEVDVDGSGEMAGQVRVATTVVPERPPHVEQHDPPAGHQEVGDRNEDAHCTDGFATAGRSAPRSFLAAMLTSLSAHGTTGSLPRNPPLTAGRAGRAVPE